MGQGRGVGHGRIGPRLAVLAAAAFVYVTSETFPIALLPQMADGLGVGEAAVGRLVTVYAAVVAVTAVPLVALARRAPRRALVTGMVAALCVSNLVVAVAPGYPTVLAARLVGALAHGVFWSVLAPVAAGLVGPERAGRATATVFLGNSLALVAGTPLVTGLGVALGWRSAAAILAVVAGLCAVLIRAALPALPAPDTGAPVVSAVRTAVRDRPLLGLCGTTVLLVTGHFAAYTYVTLFVRRDVGVDGGALALVLFGYGAAGVVGTVVVGRALDASPRATAVAATAVVAASLLGLGLLGVGLLGVGPVGPALPAVGLVAVLAWGGAFTSVPACLQTAVLRVAPGSGELESAVYVVAFQVGIAAGALVGGVFVSAGAFPALPFAAAAAVAAGLLAVLVGRRAFPSARVPSTAAPADEAPVG